MSMPNSEMNLVLSEGLKRSGKPILVVVVFKYEKQFLGFLWGSSFVFGISRQSKWIQGCSDQPGNGYWCRDAWVGSLFLLC